jgi:hypothetical protein
MSSASPPDFRPTLRHQQRPSAPSLSSSSSVFGVSGQAQSIQVTQPATTPTTITTPAPHPATLDPTFEPLERAGRAINDGIRKDDRFPELDQLVQRIPIIFMGLMI